MKKALFFAVLAVLTIALCIGSFAANQCAIDGIYVNENKYNNGEYKFGVGQPGTDGLALAQSITINKGDKVYVLGWFVDSDASVDKLIYRVDGVAYECQDNYRDRKEIKTLDPSLLPWIVDYDADDFTRSGFGTDADMMELLGIGDLAAGQHTFELVGKFVGGSELVIKTCPLTIVGNDTPANYRDFSKDAGDKLSFDQILVNGTEIANGNSAIIAAKKNIDGTKGDINTVTLHGWYGNANQDIDKFGYQINGGTIIYGEYKAATEPQVLDPTQGGGPKASRFTMDIDVSNLRGENTIWVYVKLANGEEVKLNRFENRGTADEKDREIYVVYNGPAAAPNTADASMIIFIVAAAAIALVVLKKKVF